MPNGPLSLAAKLYLLAWDTERLALTSTSYLAQLVRAGALTELAQRGLLLDADGVAKPVDDANTGDPVLDKLLELIGESRPQSWKTWVGRQPRFTLDEVCDQLASAGYLRVETKRLLGLFPRRTIRLERSGVPVVEELRGGAQRVLHSSGDVAEVPVQDAALVALAAAGELRTVLSAREAKDRAARIDTLAERGAATAPELRKVISELRTALTVAVTTTVVTTIVVNN
ncbi:GOLPH3/VPS74 family protein [Streptomyces sp. H27-D2]|uniref:GOLPH3/VPS74 family protein n=1 Tax=Streptomyces sp. H27-D2 TaxID=3046304 RepID=UPI002DBCCEF2|nr:GPP34 family phosphoprotein [Streptomyces sp. H27-D2]MEC4017506.1 GPP34 family phosphoprotein [Streptomyces sp. H27-D2]